MMTAVQDPRKAQEILTGNLKCHFKIPERHSVEKRLEQKSVLRTKKCCDAVMTEVAFSSTM